MQWQFDRDDETLILETRYDSKEAKFVVVVDYPDGSRRTDRFVSVEEFHSWLVRFRRILKQQHWARRSKPQA